MSEKEEMDMLKENSVRLSERIEELKRNKTPVKIKNGTMLIDKKHPDYQYWMED